MTGPVEPYVCHADWAIPDLDIRAGDAVSVTPGDEEPIVASHPVPVDYSRIFRGSRGRRPSAH